MWKQRYRRGLRLNRSGMDAGREDENRPCNGAHECPPTDDRHGESPTLDAEADNLAIGACDASRCPRHPRERSGTVPVPRDFCQYLHPTTGLYVCDV